MSKATCSCVIAHIVPCAGAALISKIRIAALKQIYVFDNVPLYYISLQLIDKFDMHYGYILLIRTKRVYQF